MSCMIERLIRLTGGIAVCLFIPWTAQAEPTAIGFSGQPFGVGMVSIQLDPTADTYPVNYCGYEISEPNSRVYYPVFSERRVLGVLRQLLGTTSRGAPSSILCFFLFQGTEPLTLTVFTPSRHTVTVIPQDAPQQHDELLQRWWRQYSAVAELRARDGDYPPLLEKYLMYTLAHRFGFQPITPPTRPDSDRSLERESALLMLNCEAMRLKRLEETLRAKSSNSSEARLPLPEPIAWTDGNDPNTTESVEIEPIAQHVPEECFYVRFGSFGNYLWLERQIQRYGGNLKRMVTLRGHTFDFTGRVERQLGLSKTVLAQLLGEQLISDMVILGQDAYVREGAAIGVLFEAKSELLTRELMKQRSQAVEQLKQQDATMQELQLGTHPATLASTPDNSLRSFYLVDGAYHLVTNSRTIARRFLEAGQGERSLANAPTFRQARQRFPVDSDASLFAFVSPKFLRGLMTPQYQIELRRRVRAVTDLELVQLACRAARHEGQPSETLDELIAGEFLPASLRQRDDGTQVVRRGDRFVDSLRGARGRFLPIPDVEIESVTADEMAIWNRIVKAKQSGWNLRESTALELRRRSKPGEPQEQLTIRAEAWPFDSTAYGPLIARLGPVSATAVQQADGEAIFLQFVIDRDANMPGDGPLLVCLGMQDREVPIQFAPQKLLRGFQAVRTAPVYLGIWPAVELAQIAPMSAARQPDDRGRTRLPFGLWHCTTDAGFTLLAVDPTILDEAAPRLSISQDAEPAQIRLQLADLSQSNVRSWFAALDYQRAHQTSLGNTRLLHAFIQQLGVPTDEAQAVAESILDLQLICALGGEYKAWKSPDGGTFWVSSAWPRPSEVDPSDAASFTSPMMSWFRGANARLTTRGDRLELGADVAVELSEPVSSGINWRELFSPKGPAKKP